MIDKKNNPFGYSTDPELNRIFDAMIDLKARVQTQFAKAEKIAGFTTDAKFLPLTAAKIDLPDYRKLYTPSNSWYKKNSVEIIDKQVQDGITLANSHLDEVDDINKPLQEHNNNIRVQVIELMSRLGIDQTYNTYEYATTRSRTKKTINHIAGYINDLGRFIPQSNVTSLRYTLKSYINDYNNWKTSILEAERKRSIEADEQTVKTKILGNPYLTQKLMEAGINVLYEVNKAEVGKKSAIIEYCIVKAISDEKNKINPSLKLLEELEELHTDIHRCGPTGE